MMKILGVTFDERLHWTNHISNVCIKVKKSIHAIRQIRKHKPQHDMLKIATAYCYSIMYYASPIWLGSFLLKTQWKHLKSISAQIIASALSLEHIGFSHNDLHEISARAMPKSYSDYSTLVMLKRILDSRKPTFIYNEVTKNSVLNDRTNRLYIRSKFKKRIGLNSFMNRISEPLKKIPASILSMDYDHFKTICKKILL